MTRIMRTRTVPENAARGARRKPLVLESLEERTVPSFLPAVNYPVGSEPWGLATGDFNADGNRDFAVGSRGSISVRLGVGDGTFQGPMSLPALGFPYWVTVADLDSDICDDLLYTHGSASTLRLVVQFSNCDGTFASRVRYAAGPEPSGIAVADYDLDGYLDVATVSNNGIVSVLPGSMSGFGVPVHYTTGDFAALIIRDDVNSDGAPDLIVSGDTDGIHVLMNNGDGTFAAAVNYATGSVVGGVVSVDLNGDSLPDLAGASHGSDSISILIGNGDGTYQAATHIDLGPKTYPLMIAVADYDLNGTPDLTVSHEGVNHVSVLLGNGDASFQTPLTFPTPPGAFNLVTDDFNLDGYNDLLTANQVADNASVLLNDEVWGPSPQGGGNGGVVWQLAQPRHSGFVSTPSPDAPRATGAAAATARAEPTASPISADVVSAARHTETIAVVDELFGLNLL